MGVEREAIINLGDTISYVPATPDYGKAEFVVCPVFKRGFIRECYIYPQQQHTDDYYKLVVPPHLKIRIIYLSGHYPDEPHIWRTFWCREHKCHSLEFYVPDKGNSFKVGCSLGDTLLFDWHNGSKD